MYEIRLYTTVYLISQYDVMGIYLSKALTCMKIFLFKQEVFSPKMYNFL